MNRGQILNIAQKWENILRPYFPGVYVSPSTECPDFDGVPVLDVFFVPDDKMRDFTKFLIHERDRIMVDCGFPDVSLVAHSVSSTREHYSEIRIKRDLVFGFMVPVVGYSATDALGTIHKGPTIFGSQSLSGNSMFGCVSAWSEKGITFQVPSLVRDPSDSVPKNENPEDFAAAA